MITACWAGRGGGDFRGAGSTAEFFEGTPAPGWTFLGLAVGCLLPTSGDRPAPGWTGFAFRSVVIELLHALFSFPLPFAVVVKRPMGIVGICLGIMGIAGILSTLVRAAVSGSLVISKLLAIVSRGVPTVHNVRPCKVVMIKTTQHILWFGGGIDE